MKTKSYKIKLGSSVPKVRMYKPLKARLSWRTPSCGTGMMRARPAIRVQTAFRMPSSCWQSWGSAAKTLRNWRMK